MSILSNDLLTPETRFALEYKKYSIKDKMPETHYHPHFEIYYQLSGERYYFIQNKTYHIQAGDVVLINQHTIHKTLEAKQPQGERLLINFSPTYFEAFVSAILTPLLVIFQTEMPIIQSGTCETLGIDTAIARLNHSDLADTLHTQVLLVDLLLLIQKAFTTPATPYHPQIASAPKFKKIESITEYIDTHYASDLALTELAHTFYMSPSYLSRLFKQGTGISLSTYITYVRINKAQVLLRDSTLSMTAISEAIGFETPTYFGRVFRDMVGMPPSHYRTYHQKLS